MNDVRSRIQIATVSSFVIASLAPDPLLAAGPGVNGGLSAQNYSDLTYPRVAASTSILSGDVNASGSSSNGSPSGISAQPNNDTTLPPLAAGVPLSTSKPPRVGLFPGFGKTLLDDGIEFHGIAFDHFLGNPSAGSITGQTYNLAGIVPAVDLDLGKIANIPGGYLHVRVTFFGLRSNIPTIITDAGGYLTGNQTTPAPSTTQAVISVLTYEQKLLADRLSIEVGRTSIFRYFLSRIRWIPSATFPVSSRLPVTSHPAFTRSGAAS